jgi:ribosomal protein S18 acetylase RimI-like enzyme
MGKPQFIIRTALPADAPAIGRLNNLFNGVDEPTEHYAARLSDPHRVDTPILAELDGRVIGLANLRLLTPVFYSEPYAELTELFVEEGFRRLGAGTALVAFVEELARKATASEMLLLTGVNNHPAQAFYQSLGYQSCDIALSKKL